MRKRLYQIRDVVSCTMVGPIFTEKSDPPAARAFFDICANKDTPMGQHPGDYELLVLAEYSDADGEILEVSGFPVVVASGAELSSRSGKDVTDAE